MKEYRLVIVSGRVRHEFMGGLLEQEAMEIGDSLGWQWSEETGGFVWDLEIEEDK